MASLPFCYTIPPRERHVRLDQGVLFRIARYIIYSFGLKLGCELFSFPIDQKDYHHSCKMEVTSDIVKTSMQIGDKVVIVTHNIATLGTLSNIGRRYSVFNLYCVK